MVGLSVFLLIGIIAILADKGVRLLSTGGTFPFMDFGTSIGGKNLSYPIILDENQKSTATSHCSSYD